MLCDKLDDQLTTSVSTRSPQRELLVGSRNEEVKALVVVVRVWVGGATSLITLTVVVVTRVACGSNLGGGVAC